MKRKLPPRPPEPPPDKMWFNGKFWDIAAFERAITNWHERPGDPEWRDDPSYDWREQCKNAKIHRR